MANLIYTKIMYEKLTLVIDFVINKLDEEIINELALLDTNKNNRNLLIECNDFIDNQSHNVINSNVIVNYKLNELQSIML